MQDGRALPVDGSPRAARRRPWAALAGGFRRRVLGAIDPRLAIYRWNPQAAGATLPGLDTLRITSLDQVPPAMTRPADPAGQPLDWYAARLAEGAAIHAATQGGRAACLLCMIERDRLPDWHMPIGAHDKVLYAAVTQAPARGRGLMPRLALAALREEWREGIAIHVDCRVWNRPARRAFEKAGFEQVAIVRGKPLKWEHAGD